MVDTLFFIVSKIVWFCISPDSLLLILLVSAALLLLFKRGSRKRELLAKKVLFTAVSLTLVITLFPVGEWLAIPLEERFETNPALPANVDGIIVLSGSEKEYLSYLWGQPELNEHAERLTAFVTLARKYPHATLIHSGGSGSLAWQALKQTEVAGQLYDNLGLDTTRILFETESRNTFENVKNTKELINPQEGETWIVVTTATHMVRTVGIFRKYNWDVIPFPVDHKSKRGKNLRMTYNFAGNLDTLKWVMREWVGVVAYWATEKTSALFPK